MFTNMLSSITKIIYNLFDILYFIIVKYNVNNIYSISLGL